MTLEEILRLVFSFFGGGLTAGLLAVLNASRLERKKQRIESLNVRIRELYGPLQFFTSSNSKFFELYEKFQVAYEPVP